MKTKLKLQLLFLAILSASAAARAQGTAFTYQGRLNDNGSLANGDYDLKFSVFDDPITGSQVGDSLTNAPTSVSNGLFTVTLDFGGTVFTGAPRWLEIGVTPNGSGEDFTALSSRQALTASPYAIFAGTSANVASGSVVTGLNGLKDEVTLAAGENLTITPNGNTLTFASVGAGGSGIWSVSNNNAYYNAGNVGIGTTLPATALEANGIVRSTRSGNASQYIQLNGGDSGSIKLTAQSIATAEKILFIENLSGEGTPGANNNMQFVLGTAAARSTKMTITKDGNVGIGTATPQERLTIANVGGQSSGLKITGPGVNGIGMAIENIFSGGHKWDLVSGSNFDPFNPATVGNFCIVDETAGGATRLVIDPNGSVGIGTINPQARLDVRGTTRTCVLTITGGCDIAEPFLMDASDAPKGSVVVIDEESPGRLKLSDRAYDTRVAGIVSGANGINPGISLQQEGVLEGGQNVALSGRVYVQADAGFGAIKPGDLLTTSSTPGHAMKVTDHAQAQGAILGKAMSALKDGKGMVLVLVTLQ